VIIGAAAHLLVQLPALRAVGMRWGLWLDLASSGTREVLRLMLPRVIGLAAAQVNLIVVIFFASFVSDEAISAVNYAFLVMLLPVGVIGMAISTAVFPTLAQQAATQRLTTLRDSLELSLRVILFLAIPASVGLILLAEPVVRLLLQRGEFDAASTDLVAGALMLYAGGVFAHSGVEILSRGFYAVADTRTPVQVAVLTMLLNVALCAALVAPFGIEGLAAAASIAAIVEFALLLRYLHRRMAGLRLRELGASTLRTALATVVMAQAVFVLLVLLDSAGLESERFGGAAAQVVLGTAAGFVTFVAAAWLARSAELRALRQRLGV
jgi:putative peptidoglycan lipid II flippase